ncbi:MAG: hypothetical protein JW896_09910 [Deltaproteobacteria bacterium]|nr:hypothetical protein [Deltaproteobacteria bacterium]
MPITYRTYPEHNLVIIKHEGRIDDDEFLAFYKGLYQGDTSIASMNHLVDLREADSNPRSPDVLHQFASFMKSSFEGLTTHPKVAVVAPKDLSFGLARMYEAFADSVPWDFVVFRDIDSALTWLGLPKDLMNGDDAQHHA